LKSVNIKYSIFFFFAILKLFLACSSPRYVLDTAGISFDVILDNISREQHQIVSLEAFCRISVDSPEFSGNFFSDIIFIEDDSLLISISGPFGIKAGTLFIGKERFIFFNQVANKFYNGSVQEFKDKKFFQFPLSLTEMTNVLVGRETLTSMKITEYTIKNAKFYIAAQKADFDYQIWINHKTGHIHKVIGSREGETVFIREYDDYVKINGIYFPKKISMTRPQEKQAFSIYYNNIALNEEVNREKFVINISDRAEQIDYFLNSE
jgi:hypothetical protein